MECIHVTKLGMNQVQVKGHLSDSFWARARQNRRAYARQKFKILQSTYDFVCTRFRLLYLIVSGGLSRYLSRQCRARSKRITKFVSSDEFRSSYLFLFLPNSCGDNISRMLDSMILQFIMIMCHGISLAQISFQGHQSSVTSSMTSFMKMRFYEYLINGTHSDNQNWHASSSGQGSTIRPTFARARVKTDAHARVKILTCSNRPRILFAHVSGHFKHFMSARAYRRARARTLYRSKNSSFFDWFGCLSKFSIIWNLSRTFWTNISACAREKPQKSTRTRIG